MYGQMDKQIVLYLHTRLLLLNKKEKTLDTGYSMSECQKYAEQKKAGIKECILYDSIYMKFNVRTSKTDHNSICL